MIFTCIFEAIKIRFFTNTAKRVKRNSASGYKKMGRLVEPPHWFQLVFGLYLSSHLPFDHLHSELAIHVWRYLLVLFYSLLKKEYIGHTPFSDWLIDSYRTRYTFTICPYTGYVFLTILLRAHAVATQRIAKQPGSASHFLQFLIGEDGFLLAFVFHTLIFYSLNPIVLHKLSRQVTYLTEDKHLHRILQYF